MILARLLIVFVAMILVFKQAEAQGVFGLFSGLLAFVDTITNSARNPCPPGSVDMNGRCFMLRRD